MSNSNAKLWVHLVFSSKDRMPLITDSIEANLYNHIRRKLINEFDCFVEEINGYFDHIHILFKMSEKHSLENIVKNVKGESSQNVSSPQLRAPALLSCLKKDGPLRKYALYSR